MSDLQYALRRLRRNPGFAAAAILSLALGIGATTAIYSVFRVVLLDPLPVPAPEQLVAAGWSSGNTRVRGILSINSTSYRDERTGRGYGSNFSYSLYRAFRHTAGDDLFAFSYAGSDVGASFAGQSIAASGLLVSGNFFRALGVRVMLGRPLDDGDDRPATTPAAVLTDAFWKRAFGGDPAVVGRAITLNGSAFTIVGVTAPGFYGMSRGGAFFKPSDLVLPLAAEPLVYTHSTPRSLLGADDKWWVQVMARVQPGASRTRLESALDAAFRATLAGSSLPALRDASAGELRLLPAARGLDSWTRELRQPLLILGVVVAVVLLIACVNVATLMLVRGVARQKELSIRLAIGSSRWQLVRGLLAESVVLALAGGVLGVLVGVWGARALIATIVSPAAKGALDVGLDARLLGTTVAISAAAAVLFGILPAVRTARVRLAPALAQVATGAPPPRLAAGRILMAAQIAVSLPLLVGASLFLRTVANLTRVDLGFTPDRMLIFHVDPSLSGYDADRTEHLYAAILERLGAIPGVTSATISDIVLMSGQQNNWTFAVPGAEPRNVKFLRIGPAYFETVGIAIVAGRAIGVQDHGRAPRVALVNEAAARTFFGADSPIGRRLTMQSNEPAVYEIVGVVKDSRYVTPRDPVAPPTVYLPYAQTTLGRAGPMNVVVRSALPAAVLAGLARSAVGHVDPKVPITDVRTELNQIDDTLGTERTFMRLLVVFGAFALLLASVGLHGVTAYTVARRTSEIGVRVALGAHRADVVWLILKHVVGITAAGLAIGLPAALALTRFVRAFLYGIEPTDPLSVAAAVLVMSVVALTAGFLPARRAARLDPLTALRHD